MKSLVCFSAVKHKTRPQVMRWSGFHLSFLLRIVAQMAEKVNLCDLKHRFYDIEEMGARLF